MPKRTAATITAAALILLTLTGCAGSPEEATSEPQSAPQSAPAETAEPEEAQKMSTASSADITAPGEVCDPGNMNDPICAAFYPDQAVLNITARSADLDGMSDAEKIERAQLACEGGEPTDSPLYKAGAIAYCNEFAPGIDGQPDRYARLIAFYKGLGEDAAKEHFADKVMPTPEELGY